MADVFANEEIAGKVSMRFGVFVDAKQEADIEERFVCATIAANESRDDSAVTCGFYDSAEL